VLRVFRYWLFPLDNLHGYAVCFSHRFLGDKNLTSSRVFYEVNHAAKVVTVLAIGVKKGNRLFIGGQEFEL